MDRVDHFGRDLFVALDREPTARPLRVQLEEQLRDGVRSGRLHAGTALPVDARAGRRARGGARRRGRGLRAARRRGLPRGAAAGRPRAWRRSRPPSRRPSAARGARAFRPCASTCARSPPSVGAFPRGPWLAAMRRALADAPDADLGYGSWAGAPRAARGPRRLPRPRARRGRRPRQHRRHRRHHPGDRAAGRAAARPRGAPRPRRGAGLLAAPHHPAARRPRARPRRRRRRRAARRRAAAPRRPRSSPPRTSSPPARSSRRSAARRCSTWAAAHDALVIEDDYDGEYRYDREPLGALQGLGAGRVAYLGSTSKTLAPALRLGWMVLPGALAGAIADERGWADGGSPALDQLALASFIERGELDRHLRRMRLRYRRRRDRLVAALGERPPRREVGGAAAGLHITVALAPDADVDAVVARASRARRRGLRHPARRPAAAPGRLRQHRRGGHRGRRPRAGGRGTRLAGAAHRPQPAAGHPQQREAVAAPRALAVAVARAAQPGDGARGADERAVVGKPPHRAPDGRVPGDDARLGARAQRDGAAGAADARAADAAPRDLRAPSAPRGGRSSTPSPRAARGRCARPCSGRPSTPTRRGRASPRWRARWPPPPSRPPRPRAPGPGTSSRARRIASVTPLSTAARSGRPPVRRRSAASRPRRRPRRPAPAPARRGSRATSGPIDVAGSAGSPTRSRRAASTTPARKRSWTSAHARARARPIRRTGRRWRTPPTSRRGPRAARWRRPARASRPCRRARAPSA